MTEEFDVCEDESVLHEADFPTITPTGPTTPGKNKNNHVTAGAATSTPKTHGFVDTNPMNSHRNETSKNATASNIGIFDRLWKAKLAMHSFEIPVTWMLYISLLSKQATSYTSLNDAQNYVTRHGLTMQHLKEHKYHQLLSYTCIHSSPLEHINSLLGGLFLGMHFVPNTGALPFWFSFVMGGLSGSFTFILEYYYHYYRWIREFKDFFDKNNEMQTNTKNNIINNNISNVNEIGNDISKIAKNSLSTVNQNTNEKERNFGAYQFLDASLIEKIFENANGTVPVSGSSNGLFGIMGFDLMYCLHRLYSKFDLIVKNPLKTNQLYRLSKKDQIWTVFHVGLASLILKIQIDNVRELIGNQEDATPIELENGLYWESTANQRHDDCPNVPLQHNLRRFTSFLAGCTAYYIYYKYQKIRKRRSRNDNIGMDKNNEAKSIETKEKDYGFVNRITNTSIPAHARET